MAASMEASMFIMFNMYVHVCVHACMHMCACMGHPHPPTHPSTHPTHPQGGWPPNQLKCYNTWTKLRYFNSVWTFEICVDSPTYGWVYGFVGWLMDGSFFWHLTAYLNRLSSLQGYFGEFWMGYMEEHISTMSSTMLATTQFQAVDTPRFTRSMILKCEILYIGV